MQTVEIQTGTDWEPERIYIFDIVIRGYMGLDYQFSVSNLMPAHTKIRLRSSDQYIIIPDVLFSTPEDKRLDLLAMPMLPLDTMELPNDLLVSYPGTVERTIPVVYGKRNLDGNWLSSIGNDIYCGLDIFGSAFFLLSRMEEYVNPARDEYSCFPSYASIAVKENFLRRPIVNEYIELLIGLLKRTTSLFEIKKREYSFIPTHDIDHVFPVIGKTLPVVLKNAVGDIVKRYDASMAADRIAAKCRALFGNDEADPANTFDYLMTVSEAHDVKSAFYFISGHSEPTKDPDYSMTTPFISKTITRIAERSHEVGFHPSYNTLLDRKRLQSEFKKLRDCAEQLGVRQAKWGGRQHYLRWRVGDTWQDWEDTGLSYDSTLGYYDVAGFRCSACFPFKTFSVVSRKSLNIIERPLVAMDIAIVTLENKNGIGSAFDEILRYIDICKYFNGEFVLLWHNTSLSNKRYKYIYENIVRHAA